MEYYCPEITYGSFFFHHSSFVYFYISFSISQFGFIYEKHAEGQNIKLKTFITFVLVYELLLSELKRFIIHILI